MDKKSVDMKKNENRSELVGKVDIKENDKKKSTNKKKVNVDLEQTIALDTVEILRNGKVKAASADEKRSELVGKISNKKKVELEERKKIKSRKLKLNDVSMEETKEDKVDENVESISLAMIAMVVLFCVVVLFVLGFMLQKIAITNSDVVAFIFRTIGF